MKPQLNDLLNLVAPYITDKWEKICIQLFGDEHRHVMTTIRRNHHGDSEKSCDTMFEQWLDLCPHANWNDLIDVLRTNSVKKIFLAEQLTKHVGVYSYTIVWATYISFNVTITVFCVYI